MKKNSTFRGESDNISIYIFFIVMSLIFIIPLGYIVAISLSSESDILKYGYQLIPKKIDFTAYKFVFGNPEQTLYSYGTTIFFSVVGTFLSVLIMGMVSYPLSQRSFRLKIPISFYIFFTMLFSGGLVPSYILITQYLHLQDTIWVYIFPSLVTPFYILMLMTFFKSVPSALFESADIDGASEFRIFFTIVLPLSKPVLATVSLMCLLGRWNDWFTSILYIQNTKLYSLQYVLQKILTDVDFLRANYDRLPSSMQNSMERLPSESARMAICILVAGPMLVIFPLFQKYFTKGLTVGALKG